jgi:hypothetical protein
MSLSLVGIDPGTNGGNCPAVWVDEDTGDLIFQGAEVQEPDVLSEVSAKNPLLGHEKLVRLPARMRDIIREASS